MVWDVGFWRLEFGSWSFGVWRLGFDFGIHYVFFFRLVCGFSFISLIVELVPNLGSYIGYNTQVFSYVYIFFLVVN